MSDPEVASESTLDSEERPGDRPIAGEPERYVSIRVTLEHDRWPEIEECFDGSDWYIAYPHTGKNGNNPHFHVLLPGTKTELDKYRKRLKGAGVTGNKQLRGCR